MSSDIYKQLLNNSLSHPEYTPGDKVVLEVRFSGRGKTYCYTADSGIYMPGEKMLVKVDDSYKPVTIVNVHYFYPNNYPFNTLQIKKAVRADSDYTPVKATAKKTAKKHVKEERKLPDWLLEGDDEIYETPAITKTPKAPAENKSYPSYQPKTTSAASYGSRYSSSYDSSQSKSKKWLIILAIIFAIGIFQGPTWYRNYVNSKPLVNNEILGHWNGYNDIEFYRDGTFKSAYMQFLTGKWEVQSAGDNTIRLWYCVTPAQAEAYNNEFYYDLEGDTANREDILEWELDELDGDIPPEGIYRFMRKENRLEYIEDDDCYFYR